MFCVFFLRIFPSSKEESKTAHFVSTHPPIVWEIKQSPLEKPIQVQTARAMTSNGTYGDLMKFIFLSLYAVSNFLTRVILVLE